MQHLFVFVLGLAFLSCKEDLPQAGENEIVIQLNQTVSKLINEKEWEVSFMSLEENSLCQKGHQCIWAGRIIVLLEINGNQFKLGAGDLFPRNGEEAIANELFINNTKITLIDSYDRAMDEGQWIKLKFESK